MRQNIAVFVLVPLAGISLLTGAVPSLDTFRIRKNEPEKYTQRGFDSCTNAPRAFSWAQFVRFAY